jgi:hypothetical protein
MSAEPVTTKGPPRVEGLVFAEISIRNGHDLAMARRDDSRPGAVREVLLDQIRVDSYSTHLALPMALVEPLGLDFMRDVAVRTSRGLVDARLVGPAELEVNGRAGTLTVLELPGDYRPLLGFIPMQLLGIEPDVLHHTVRLRSPYVYA